MQQNGAISLIKERLGIVRLVSRYIQLRNVGGGRWTAPCPFHQETKPSFFVNEEWGAFFCFGCGAKGDIFTFYSKINGVDFRTALHALAEEAGVTLESRFDREQFEKQKKEQSVRQTMLQMYEFAAGFFASQLKGPDGALCRDYIGRRGLSREIIEHFSLGWAKDSWEGLSQALRQARFPMDLAVEAGLLGKGRNGYPYDRFRSRLMFPIRTFPSTVIAFGGRIIQDVDEAKYINSSDSPIYRKGDHLYGLVQAAPSIRSEGYALLTEGYMDVLTLHQFGYTNSVGVLGTSLTDSQIDRLTKGFTSRLVLLFDGDRAGRKAALRACEMIVPKGLLCSVVLLPDPEDIDSLLRMENGRKIFDDLLSHAVDGMEFLARELHTLAPRDMIQRAQAFLRSVQIPELYSYLATRLSALLGLSEVALRQGVAELREKSSQLARIRTQHRTPPADETLSMIEKQILMFAARYPEQTDLLMNLGADLALHSSAARAFWEKIQDRDNCPSLLTPAEKKLWDQWCGRGAPPLGENYERELQALRQFMDRVQRTESQALVTEALRHTGAENAAAEARFLEALQHTVMERHHE